MTNIPKYITTICDERYKNLNYNIILIGKNDGKIYSTFNDKISFINNLKYNLIPLICCIKNTNINYDENKILKLNNILVLSENEIDKIQSKYDSKPSFFNY
jgi:hypothetical protein